MKKERKEDSFIKQPFYEGGDKALKLFVSQNLKYPESSKLNRISGHVNVRYEINHKGEVIDVKIIAGLDDHCNEEASRVVKLLKFIVPKNPRNLKVSFHKTLRINFGLTEEKRIVHPDPIISNPQPMGQTPNSNFQYTITVAKPQAPDQTKPQPTSYHYTVKI